MMVVRYDVADSNAGGDDDEAQGREWVADCGLEWRLSGVGEGLSR